MDADYTARRSGLYSESFPSCNHFLESRRTIFPHETETRAAEFFARQKMLRSLAVELKSNSQSLRSHAPGRPLIERGALSLCSCSTKDESSNRQRFQGSPSHAALDGMLLCCTAADVFRTLIQVATWLFSGLLVITDITYRVHVIGRFHYPYTGRISTLEWSV
jgi:hypothetical protein